MIVSIFTDASYDNKTSVAAFVYVIKYKDDVYYKADLIQDKVESCQHAELYAIYLAINECRKLFDCRVLFIKTDSQFAIDKIMNLGAHNKAGYYTKTLLKIKRIRNEFGYTLRFKHVKAHTGKKDTNSLINNWCDNAAKYVNRNKTIA